MDPFAEAHRRAVPNIMTMSCVLFSSPEKGAVTDEGTVTLHPLLADGKTYLSYICLKCNLVSNSR